MQHAIRSTGTFTIVCALWLVTGLQARQAKPAVPSAQPTAPSTAPPAKAASDNRLTSIGGLIIDYPKKDWQVLGGVGSALVVFLHNSRQATVAIERLKLEVPQTPDEITERSAKLEIEDWQVRRPLAYGFSAPTFVGPTRTMLHDFTQPGPQGVEHVRLYTMLRGLDRWRVVCTTPQTTFTKYMDACHHIALSLYPTTTNQ